MHENLDAAVRALIDCYRSGGKLLLCGNGGSSADCAHITGELVKGFRRLRPLDDSLKARIAQGEAWTSSLQAGLPAVDLTANCALISAVANDIGAENAYAQQVLAYGRAGDVLIGISTSGNAENVCRAMKTARALGITTVGMTGEDGGRMRPLSDILLNVPARETYQVQELHLPLYHQLCMRVEAAFFDR